MANAVASRTSPVIGTVVTHRIPNKKDGVHCYLKYTKGDGTSMSLKFTFIDPELHPTDEYQQIYLNATMAPAVLTYPFSASGNYRIPVPLALGEKAVKATVTFTGGTTQEAVVDFRNE